MIQQTITDLRKLNPTSSQPTEPDSGSLDGKELKQRLLERQAQRISLLQSQIDQAKDEIDRLKDDIASNLQPGTYEAGDLKVTVRTGSRRINENRFRAAYPPETYPQLYRTAKPDAAKARKLLGALVIDPLLDPAGKTTVTVQ